MATYDDILGNGSGTPFPKGSKEWHEQQQDGSSASPPVKGTGMGGTKSGHRSCCYRTQT